MMRAMRRLYNNVFTTLKSRSSGSKRLLGRWQRHSKDAVVRKVDLSNHDHCGGELCSKVPQKGREKRIVVTLVNQDAHLYHKTG